MVGSLRDGDVNNKNLFLFKELNFSKRQLLKQRPPVYVGLTCCNTVHEHYTRENYEY